MEVQGSCCHTNVLHLAPLTFDQIDYTLCLASDRSIGFTSGCAFECVCFLDVITGLLLHHLFTVYSVKETVDSINV